MLDYDAMCQLREAYDPYAPATEHDVLAKIGNPSPDEIVDAALAGLASDDRNVRVLMLRVLKRQSGPKAMQGILAGLNDPKRRAREVAIKCSANYHSYPEITERLKAMVADEHETRRIRSLALNSLAGGIGPLVSKLTASGIESLGSLAKLDAYRAQVLFGLLRLDLTPGVADLLREFVASGSKEEAVMATRALCGFRVVNLGQVGEAAKEYVQRHCETAAGRVWYWVRREDWPALRVGQIPAPGTDR